MAAMDRFPEAALLLNRCCAADTTTQSTPSVPTGSAASEPFRSHMQRDYLSCYLQLSQLSLGASLADAPVATGDQTPVDSLVAVAETSQRYVGLEGDLGEQWQKRWRDMHEYITELRAEHTAQHAAQGEAAAQQDLAPHRAKRKQQDAFLTLDTTDESHGVITVLTVPSSGDGGGVATGEKAGDGDAARAGLLQVRVREMDVEMLFSRKPFEGISGDIGAAAFVVPRYSVEVPTDPSGSTTLDLRLLLPGALRFNLCMHTCWPMQSRSERCMTVRFFPCIFFPRKPRTFIRKHRERVNVV